MSVTLPEAREADTETLSGAEKLAYLRQAWTNEGTSQKLLGSKDEPTFSYGAEILQ